MARELTAHAPSFATLDGLSGLDALCLFVGEDERPLAGVAGCVDWRLCGALSRVVRDRFFVGAAGDWLLLPSSGRVGPGRIFAVGLGARARLDPARLAHALQTAATVLSRAGVEEVALEIPGAGRLADGERARAFTESFLPAFAGRHVALLAEPPLAQAALALPQLAQAPAAVPARAW